MRRQAPSALDDHIVTRGTPALVWDEDVKVAPSASRTNSVKLQRGSAGHYGATSGVQQGATKRSSLLTGRYEARRFLAVHVAKGLPAGTGN